jgi:LAS superfamily LD-carboxypeptidase LdcB
MTKKGAKQVVIGLSALLIIAVAGIVRLYRLETHAQDQIVDLQLHLSKLQTENSNLESTLQNQQKLNDELASVLTNTQTELTEIAAELEDEEARLNPLRNFLSDVATDVQKQKKLALIDPELLQKYSNVYFLNENYVPSSLNPIPDRHTLKSEQIHAKVLPFLQDLLQDAAEDGVELKIASAYRSFDRQAQLKQQYTTIYGEGANQFSADQGYSEHQLGTTVDFVSPGSNYSLDGFENTTAYQWLQDNAYKYGFVLSYPPDNQFYVFEPWHWRFVGTELADDLNDENAFLYDIDQRDIQQYRLNLFD